MVFVTDVARAGRFIGCEQDKRITWRCGFCCTSDCSLFVNTHAYTSDGTDDLNTQTPM